MLEQDDFSSMVIPLYLVSLLSSSVWQNLAKAVLLRLCCCQNLSKTRWLQIAGLADTQIVIRRASGPFQELLPRSADLILMLHRPR